VFFNGSTGEDSPTPKPAPLPVEATRKIDGNEQSESVIGDYSSFTQDEFDQLSQEQQDKMLEEFVLDFWEKEPGLAETDAEENYLSLEIFARPYMRKITEREYLQLSPEDRERADAVIEEEMREIGSYYKGLADEAKSLMADKDYVTAEAYLVNLLEMGRELGANKQGLVFTRAVAGGGRMRALRDLVKLYTLTGNNSGVQMAQEQLLEEEEEREEIRKAAHQRDAKLSDSS